MNGFLAARRRGYGLRPSQMARRRRCPARAPQPPSLERVGQLRLVEHSLGERALTPEQVAARRAEKAHFGCGRPTRSVSRCCSRADAEDEREKRRTDVAIDQAPGHDLARVGEDGHVALERVCRGEGEGVERLELLRKRARPAGEKLGRIVLRARGGGRGRRGGDDLVDERDDEDLQRRDVSVSRGTQRLPSGREREREKEVRTFAPSF